MFIEFLQMSNSVQVITIGKSVNCTGFTLESTVPRECTTITAGTSSNPLGIEKSSVVVAKVQGLGYNTCYNHLDQVVDVIAIDTEIGENIQIAAFTMENQEYPELVFIPETEDNELYIKEIKPNPPIRYWVVGTKHVHVVFRHEHVEEDLEQYETKSKYTDVLVIAHLFNRVVLNNEYVEVDDFHAWLSEHKFTAIAEAIMFQYDYDSDQLQFFATTMPSAGFCAQHPHSALCSFASFGLQTPWYSDAIIFKSDEYCNFIASIKKTEDMVMYGIDMKGSVCAMWKTANA